MDPLMTLAAITLDCADPMSLATFYHRATGLELHSKSGDEFAGLVGAHGLLVGFQRVPDHRPPTWPDSSVPQQLHLCFDVADLDQAEARLLELGAGKPADQPHESRWRVLTDPAGHPFCIVAKD